MYSSGLVMCILENEDVRGNFRMKEENCMYSNYVYPCHDTVVIAMHMYLHCTIKSCRMRFSFSRTYLHRRHTEINAVGARCSCSCAMKCLCVCVCMCTCVSMIKQSYKRKLPFYKIFFPIYFKYLHSYTHTHVHLQQWLLFRSSVHTM